MSKLKADLDKAYDLKVLKTAERVKKATGFAVYAQLVENTPVDTGRAKSNWWMDVNNISVTIREPDNAASGMGQAQAVMQANTVLADAIYISNNLPYIQRLNDGYSQQAPAGFVEAAVQVGNRRGKEAAKRIR